jgi:hypothetical protein
VARRPGGGGRTGSRIDQLGACRQGEFSALRLALPSGCAPPGIRPPNRQIRTIAVVARGRLWQVLFSQVKLGPSSNRRMARGIATTARLE